MNQTLLLDTANIEEVDELCRTSAIGGVTTNPSLMAKEAKGDYTSRLKEIANLLHRMECMRMFPHLSVEAISTDPEEIFRQGMELYTKLDTPGVDLHIKVPVTVANLSVISRLADEKVKVNATACMRVMQAKLAIDAGATVVSFFWNRIKDEAAADPNTKFNTDPIDVLQRFRGMCGGKVICGSMREQKDVYEAFWAGADCVTASAKLIRGLMQHPQTDKAIRQFQEDIDKWRS